MLSGSDASAFAIPGSWFPEMRRCRSAWHVCEAYL